LIAVCNIAIYNIANLTQKHRGIPVDCIFETWFSDIPILGTMMDDVEVDWNRASFHVYHRAESPNQNIYHLENSGYN
jgi:hypothetical protein